ncbi:MAG: glycosyltransferase [Gemmatimonadetes bacterium]|nr:glycosyltransferase [Gemmatimonadota bacterium]NIY45801.1 glycosyltransferase [Gemmatimonadota bacterium]
MLLPCRDAERFLPQAIRGLELQTFADFEIVAVNDGSGDGTAAMLDRWAARDGRVRVLHREREGLAAALQAGASLCRGRLLARADADDFAHPRRLEEQVAYLSNHRDVAAVGTHVRYFPHEGVGWGARRYQRWLNSLSRPAELERDIFVECPIAHPTLMLRRAAFDKVGGYRSNDWPEDYDLLLRLHLAGGRLANVPRVRHFWREREDRASRVDSRYAPESFRRCKVHYLRRSALDGRECVGIWGAGRVGKDFARTVLAAGLRLRWFLDIDPRKIGQSIYGVPVLDARVVARHRDAYLLICVGTAGARELIRRQLAAAGFSEPAQFRCLA